jgi:hypothetical protein
MATSNNSATSSSAVSLAAATAKAKTARTEGKDVSVNYGTIDDVKAAVKAGAFVIKFQSNVSKDVAFGPSSPLRSFGGGLTAKNDGSSAFLQLRPMAYSLNKKSGEKEYISSGTTTALYSTATKEQWDQANTLASVDAHSAVAIMTFLNSCNKELDMDYNAWQALFASVNVSGEAQFNVNVPTWDSKFVTKMGALSAAGKVRSFTVYFVLQDAVMKDHGPILKSKKGETVYGRNIFVDTLCVEFSDQVIRSAVKGTKIDSDTVKDAFETVVELKAMESKVNNIAAQHEELATKKYGKKAVSNAVLAFESGLAEGKWNQAIESQLREIAASGYFNKQQTPDFFCTLAANIYFQNKEAAFDGEYVNIPVNTKAVANDVKASQPVESKTRRSAV